ncbi:hypothetical protein GbCGDNIH6_8292 [Granulibacter bethesdensis]|nr:hypothetical protein GbCGDNIH6_8292 [Granulibacter bethesdensis]
MVEGVIKLMTVTLSPESSSPLPVGGMLVESHDTQHRTAGGY